MAAGEISTGVDFRSVAAEHMGHGGAEGGVFVYEREILEGAASQLLNLELPFGHTVRYAAKANPHAEIVSLFDAMGLHFDASSVEEARRLMQYGVDGPKISLSSQVLRDGPALRDVLQGGVEPVATSLRQIGVLADNQQESIAIRVNPGRGSGHNNRTNVGGPASSFGIWHEQVEAALKQADANGQQITRLHTHIGSGADPSVWRKAIRRSLGIVDRLPDVTTLDMGGGYKVARMADETSTDMNDVEAVFGEELEQFAAHTGRELKLEIEPGTFLVANAGTLLARIEEIKETDRYKFLVLNAGMNALLRPSFYGAQHPIAVLNDNAHETEEYVVVGPCCESGDILTPAPGDPEELAPRTLPKAEVNDIVAIGGAGAYAASMSANRYNDIPQAIEVVV